MFCAEPLYNEEFVLGFMIHKPVEVIKPLIDNILVERSFVLNNDRAVVLVNAECINPTTVNIARAVFRCHEAYCEKRFKMLLDQRL